MKADTPLDSTRLLISGLAKQRARLLLTVPGLDRQSAVIPPELMGDEGYAFVTLLTPQEPTLWLPPDTEVQAEGRLHGARVHITSALRQLTRGRDEWRLDVHWPTQVQHVQRRQAFRADVPAEHGMAQARLRHGDAEPVPATVRDISLTGVGLQPPRHWTPDNDQPLTCEWSVRNAKVTLPLEVRHVSSSAQGTHLGARFLQPAASALQLLRQWVLELERYGLRRRQADMA